MFTNMKKANSEKTKAVCSKPWKDINADDLRYLYFELDLIKSEIATIFKVSKNQVRYKLKKHGINKNSVMLSNALTKAIRDTREQSIKRLIFSENAFVDSNDELLYGPVKIIKGRHKGRIGIFDDVDGKYAYVYFGDMTQSLDSWDKIPIRYLNNNITTYDLTTRIEYLRNQIFSARAKRSIGDKTALSSDTIISMYGEYTLALQLLTDVYIDTFYLQSEGNVTVFISHSSVDNELALMVASDLKRAKYNVWFDKWDLKLGHSIPQAITDGLDSADALVIILSAHYLKSAFCKDEWQGFYMKFNSQHRPIIVIIADESDPPTLLSSRKYFRMDDNNTYNDMITELKHILSEISR